MALGVCFIPVVWFSILLTCVQSSLKSKGDWQPIIGVLYHPHDEPLYESLRQTINRINKQNTLPVARLTTISFKTHSDKILGYDAAKKLKKSTFIFDLSFNNQYSYALAELLQTPMITLETMHDNIRNYFIFSLRPSEETVARATVDLVQYYMKFNAQVAILVDAKMSHLGARIFSIARYRNRIRPIMMPEANTKNEIETQRALSVLLRTNSRNVILVCKAEDTRQFIERAMRNGCVFSDSKWFVVDLELTGNISALAYRGLLGLRLYYNNQHKLKRDAEKSRNGRAKKISMASYAVLNDSLYAVSEAIRQTKQITFDNRGKDDCPIKGAMDDRGQSNFINSLMGVRFEGLTGPVEFDQKTRTRNVKIIDAVNVQIKAGFPPSFMYPIGYWKPNVDSPIGSVVLKTNDAVFWNGDYWEEIKCSFTSNSPSFMTNDFVRHHKPLIVTSIVDSPYMMLKKNHSGLTGNDRYEGFGVDMISKLAEKLKFKYEIKISTETSYGAPIGGEWKGLVGELVDQKADIALGPITITAEREEVIDFSKPFLDFRIAMILTKPEGENVNLFAFLLPFEEQLWLCVCAVVGTVTIIMYVLDRFSPYGYRAEAKDTGEGDGNEFSMSNSLWFATGSILQQGADTTPKAGSGRVLAAAFWLFTLILISTYTANLAAYFTAKNAKSTINSLEDLVSQDKVKYGVLNGGSLYTFFENSKVRTYKKMFARMKTLNTFVPSTKVGVNISRQGNFAYLTDQPSLDYYNQRKPCNTMLVKNLLDAKSYAIGLQRNSEWTNKISVTILELREEGEIEKIRLRWWDDRSECPASDAPNTAPSRLALHHLAGVFIILGGGAAISLALLLVENRCRDVLSGRRQTQPGFSLFARLQKLLGMTLMAEPVTRQQSHLMAGRPSNL
ncbi:glutamate receptor 2 isoform X2 [Exaiptasia diaphana]|uniref:Glutamate receptor n=1 Tax=Exaiptasia diaphana TaxID=2652724 RepID=A0A913X6H2_EXADI|nr:glutamate receptor 2 isoform X2 [Exaiptasia diaphana]